MKNYGNLEIATNERKNYRKISYFLGVMINNEGQRFVDEGIDFRNYTYAQFGRAVLQQPIFDSKVFDLLYAEYSFFDASFEQADTLEELVEKCDGLDASASLKTLSDFNESVESTAHFDPTIKDGKSAMSGDLAKSNWAQKLDMGPFRAFPVTGGITFTYGGVKVSKNAEVLDENGHIIVGLFACGEMVGGVFLGGYPGGSGLTSGAVFGKIAGRMACSSR